MRDILDYIEERAFCEGYEQRMFDAVDEKISKAIRRNNDERDAADNAVAGTMLVGIGGYTGSKLYGDEAKKKLRERLDKNATEKLTDEQFAKALKKRRIASGALVGLGLASGAFAAHKLRKLKNDDY